MSTREMAYSIFQQLNEEQLKGFIAMFRDFYPSQKKPEETSHIARLQNMIHPGTHVIDEKEELEAYRREKYGS